MEAEKVEEYMRKSVRLLSTTGKKLRRTVHSLTRLHDGRVSKNREESRGSASYSFPLLSLGPTKKEKTHLRRVSMECITSDEDAIVERDLAAEPLTDFVHRPPVGVKRLELVRVENAAGALHDGLGGDGGAVLRVREEVLHRCKRKEERGRKKTGRRERRIMKERKRKAHDTFTGSRRAELDVEAVQASGSELGVIKRRPGEVGRRKEDEPNEVALPRNDED
jgi:hypothetical protein